MKTTTTIWGRRNEAQAAERRDEGRKLSARVELVQNDLDGLPNAYGMTRERSVYEMPGLGWRYG